MAIENNKKWVNFINQYKSLRELWDVKNGKYKNKTARAAAYEKLKKEYENIDKNATIEKVKSRIRNMRFAYNRELRKKIASEKSGAEADDLYEPNLWYFSALEFLKEYERPEKGTSSIASSEDDGDTAVIEAKPKKKKTKTSADELIRLATQRLKNSSGICRQIAIVWGEKLSKMDRNQRIIAEKVINEVMFNGELGLLNFNTTLYNVTSAYNFSSCNKSAITNESSTQQSITNNCSLNNSNNLNDSSSLLIHDTVREDHEHREEEEKVIIGEYDTIDNAIKTENELE